MSGSEFLGNFLRVAQDENPLMIGKAEDGKFLYLSQLPITVSKNTVNSSSCRSYRGKKSCHLGDLFVTNILSTIGVVDSLNVTDQKEEREWQTLINTP